MGRRGQGEGSITQRADGRWEAKLATGYRDGKRQRKHFYGATRKAVQKKLTKALRDVQQGLPLLPERQTVKDFLTNWLKDTAKVRVRARTYAGYKQHVEQHLNPALGHIRLHELSAQQVQALLNEKAKSLAPATVVRIRATLRTALQQALKWNLVARNVAKLVDVPKRKRFTIRFLDFQEAQAFVTAAGEFRLGGVFSMAMALGLRLGEALGLAWKDVDLEKKTLTVRQTLQRQPKQEGEEHGRLVFGEPKSDKSRRTVSLPDFSVSVLKRHRIGQKEERLKAGGDWQDFDLVFTSTIGTPVDERNLRREFKAILEKAELSHMRIHDLRHTFASLLLAQGVQPKIVGDTLGHSQISLTLDTYSHLIPGLAEEAAHKIDGILTFDAQPNPLGVKVGVKQAGTASEPAAIA